MGQKSKWVHIEPEIWRTTLPGMLSVEREQELQKNVYANGPAAFTYIKKTIENDTNDEIRYRAMGWLVSLYSEPGIDKIEIVDVLRNIVNSTLKLDHSQARRDALIALVRLRQNAWEDEPDLDFLLQLSADTELNRGVKIDVLLALIETRSPDIIKPLVQGIIEFKERGLVNRFIQGVRSIQVEWTIIAVEFIRYIEKHPITSSNVDASAIVRALTPTTGGDQIHTVTEINNYIIEYSRKCNDRVTEILAKLIVESNEGDQIMAGHRIIEYHKTHNIPISELEGLLTAVGGRTALRGLMGVLQNDLRTYFQDPIHELNEHTKTSWKKTIKYAQLGLIIRLWMSGTVFIIGIILLTIGSVKILLISDNTTKFQIEIFTLLITGLGSMLLVIYTGPLKDIRQAVTDLATSSAAFIAYIHQVLETSHTFSYYYLHEDMTFERMEPSSAIIKEALTNTIENLDRKARDSSERTIIKTIKRLKGLKTAVSDINELGH